MKQIETQTLRDEVRRVFASEQQALAQVSVQVEESIALVAGVIAEAKGKVVVTGLGKSGLVGHKIAATLASTGTPAVFMNAAEALHGDLGMVSRQDVVLMISNSGSTVELTQMLPSLRKKGATIVGIFGNPESRLAQHCAHVINTHISHEACPMDLAPTSSATSALVAGDALACCLMMLQGTTPESFAENHPGGSLGRRLLLRVRDVMHQEDLPVVSPETPLHQIAVEMTRRALGLVCIVDEKRRLKGIITDGDFRRHFAHSTDFKVTAAEMMTKSPKTVSADCSLDDALKVMENPQCRVYALPVTDSRGHVEGVIRMHDVVG